MRLLSLDFEFGKLPHPNPLVQNDLRPQVLLYLGIASRLPFLAFADFRLSDGGKKALFCEFTNGVFAVCGLAQVSELEVSPWRF
jgi:hypothetical protein